MVDTGLTFEEQQMQAVHFINKLGITLKELNKKELEEEIAKFLKRLQCLSLATVNPDGTPHPKFLLGMAKMKSFLQEWSRSVQPLEDIIKRVITARVIKITPVKIIFMNLPEGIPYMRWEKEA